MVIGPESTGKSTLCEQLAQHYNTTWCPEFAREYLLTHGGDYRYEDLLDIAKGQLAMEDEFVQSIAGSPDFGMWEESRGDKPSTQGSGLLFIDTDMYVMKVWCEFVFGKCHRFILDQIIARNYDLYLLCNIDLPWIKDKLREYPDALTRKKLYAIYKDIMINQMVPWTEISGDYDERLEKAITAVDKIVLHR